MAATNGADVAVAVPGPPGSAPEVEDKAGFKLKFCTVCASNQNRCVTNVSISPGFVSGCNHASYLRRVTDSVDELCDIEEEDC
jgi:hypothetical protein